MFDPFFLLFFLQFLNSCSKENALYLARYVSFFQTQVGYDINTAALLKNLLRDNSLIIDRISEDNVDHFVTWLKKRKNADFLDFLGVLFVCEGRAMPRNQKNVISKFITNNKDGRILVGSKLEGDKILVRDRDSTTWVDLDQFIKTEADIRYFEAQLQLFAKLCHGRNKESIAIVSEVLSQDQIVAALKSDKLSGRIRAAYLDIYHNLYIDVDKNQPVLKRIRMSYVWSELEESEGEKSAKDDELSMSGERMSRFPALRDWIISVLRAESHLCTAKSKAETNVFLCSVLRLTQSLVEFGYFTSRENITALLGPLYDLLDGQTDRPAENENESDLEDWRRGPRFTNIPANYGVFRVKREALKVVDLVFGYRFSTLLNHFLLDFKRLTANSSKSSLPSHLAPLQPFFGNDKEIPVGVLHNYLTKLMAASDFIDPQGNLVSILIDLSRYQSPQLSSLALQVVNRYYTQVSDLFSKGTVARVLIAPESVTNFKRVMELLPNLRRLANVKFEDEQLKEMSSIIVELTGLCTLKDDIGEPHPANQRILVNARVLADILDVLAKPVDMSMRSKYTGLIDIRKKCFVFLKMFCRKNRAVQDIIFIHFDKLLLVEGAERELGLLIAEMFDGNESLAMKLREEHVGRLVVLLAEHQVMEIWVAINAVVRIDSFPIKRNQNFAVKHLMQNREKTILLTSKAESAARCELMMKATAAKKDGKPDLSLISQAEYDRAMYHQFQTRTIATCAEGENKFIESMCQNIYSLDDLFEVLENPKIAFEFKRPYLRFLLWVYLATSSGASNPEVTDIALEKRTWNVAVDIRERVIEIGKKDLATMAVVSPMDIVYLFEAAVPFFTYFFQRYYNRGPELDAAIFEAIGRASPFPPPPGGRPIYLHITYKPD